MMFEIFKSVSITGDTNYQGSSAQKKSRDEALVAMVASDLQPLSIVDDPGFQKFCKVMDPKYKLPSRTHLTEVLLPRLMDKVQQEVRDTTNKAGSVSITSDLWTSVNNAGFLALTCHFWREDKGMLESFLLSCTRMEGSHTGEKIAEAIRVVSCTFNIQGKILLSVTDNGANMLKAADILGLRHLGCYAHTLNLVITDAIKETPQAEDIKTKASKIVEKTKRSTKINDKLAELQKSLGRKTPLKLKQNVATRWNSVFEMLERLVEVKDAVSLLLASTDLGEEVDSFQAQHWQAAEGLIEVLKPAYEATLELSGERFATASKIIPLTRVLMAFYATQERTSEDPLKRKLSSNILRHLVRRFEKVEEIRVLAQATLLDVRFKNHCFRQDEKKKRAIACLNKELKDLYSSEDTTQGPVVSQTPSKRRRTCEAAGLWDSFDTEVQQQGSQATISDNSDIDLRNFFSLPLAPRKSNPLQWWKNEGHLKFPMLYKLATKYLSMPATSVPSERIFSTAGEIISKKRNRLGDENASTIIFLNANMK